jgi:hypothetical protein
MYRYPLGRGRRIAAVSAVVILIGCVLPWYTAGGQVGGLPPVTGNAFEASGIVVFLVALATLALVTLPYAAGDRPVAIERWQPYLIVLVIGVLGLGLRVFDLAHADLDRIWPPTRSPGLWIAGLGLIGLARATFEIAQTTDGR